MKRKDIVKQLMKEGLSDTMLALLSDNQINMLAARVLKEQSSPVAPINTATTSANSQNKVMIATNSPTSQSDIETAKKQKKTIEVYEELGEPKLGTKPKNTNDKEDVIKRLKFKIEHSKDKKKVEDAKKLLAKIKKESLNEAPGHMAGLQLVWMQKQEGFGEGTSPNEKEAKKMAITMATNKLLQKYGAQTKTKLVKEMPTRVGSNGETIRYLVVLSPTNLAQPVVQPTAQPVTPQPVTQPISQPITQRPLRPLGEGEFKSKTEWLKSKGIIKDDDKKEETTEDSDTAEATPEHKKEKGDKTEKKEKSSKGEGGSEYQKRLHGDLNAFSLNEWVNKVVGKNVHPFTSKGEIMELIKTKLTESNTDVAEPEVAVELPDFLTFDAIKGAGTAEPTTKPIIKPGTKPTTKPTPRTPFQPGPGPKHNPKAMAEEEKTKTAPPKIVPKKHTPKTPFKPGIGPKHKPKA